MAEIFCGAFNNPEFNSPGGGSILSPTASPFTFQKFARIQRQDEHFPVPTGVPVSFEKVKRKQENSLQPELEEAKLTKIRR